LFLRSEVNQLKKKQISAKTKLPSSSSEEKYDLKGDNEKARIAIIIPFLNFFLFLKLLFLTFLQSIFY
jgi:hypothetical protein